MIYTLQPKWRIRRCEGNREAWMIVRLGLYGAESGMSADCMTALSLDGLAESLALVYHQNRLGYTPGDAIELVLT